jgi:hypothetical protein
LIAATWPESRNEACGPNYTVRVSPPLMIIRDEIHSALELFDAALSHPEAA